ncbi:MAG: O-antigen ligase family protein [Eubacteriales bacterium]
MEYYFYLLIFLVPYLAISPWQKPLGVSNGVIFAFMVMLFVMWLLINKPVKLKWRSIGRVPLIIPLVIFFTVSMISLSKTVVTEGVNTIGLNNLQEIGYLVFAIVFYWAVVNFVDNRQKLVLSIQVFIAAATTASMYGLVRMFLYMLGSRYGEAYNWTVPRLAATAGEPQVFGSFIITILPLAVAVVLFKITALKTGWNYLAVPVLLLALIMTYSAGAWAGFGLAVGFLAVWLPYYNFRQAAAVFLIFAVVGFSIVLIDKTIYPNYLEAFNSITYKITGKVPPADKFQNKDTYEVLRENSNLTPASKDAKYMESLRSKVERSWFRAALWKMFKSSPVLGIGPGNFAQFYDRFQPVGSEKLSYIPKPHNQYMEILAETGLVGSLSFGALIICLVGYLYRAWCRGTKEDRKLLVAMTA